MCCLWCDSPLEAIVSERGDMSYCVNCGVELDASARECPLCNTPVLNPEEYGGYAALIAKLSQIPKAAQGENPEVATPFPKEKGQVETVNRKDLGILLSMVVLATAATCGILNALVFQGVLWSLTVIGACVVLWVIMIPAVIYKGQPVYVSLLYDGAAVAIYLYMLTYLTRSKGWVWGLGIPITVLVTVIAELMTLCIRKLPRSFLTVALYLFTAAGLLCMGLEMLIDRYLAQKIALSWSAVVLTVCGILDIAVITMLSRRHLREEMRRRLHF